MTKIFAIYFKINLTQKPEWFDEFRDAYQGTKILHVTLVQPRFIEEDQVPNIKSKIQEVLNKYNFTDDIKKIIFNKLESGEGMDWKYVFMLLAEENKTLINFQKDLVVAMRRYSNYCDEPNKEYETNFKPHLTIGVNIEPKDKDKALRYFYSEYTCVGAITELILPVVKDRSVEEADNIKHYSVEI